MVISLCGVKIRIIFWLTHSCGGGRRQDCDKKKIGFVNDGDKSYFISSKKFYDNGIKIKRFAIIAACGKTYLPFSLQNSSLIFFAISAISLSSSVSLPAKKFMSLSLLIGIR